MTATLATLIQQARTQLGSTACQAGRHSWGFEGGRTCPHDLDDNCSQAVYVCIVCGTQDYGQPGGPGDQDCASHCKQRVERALAIGQSRRDPLEYSWPRAVQAGHSPIKVHQMLLTHLRRQPKAKLP